MPSNLKLKFSLGGVSIIIVIGLTMFHLFEGTTVINTQFTRVILACLWVIAILLMVVLGNVKCPECGAPRMRSGKKERGKPRTSLCAACNTCWETDVIYDKN